METTNPYDAPEVDDLVSNEESSKFSQLNFKALQKLYYRSINVSTIAGLIILGTIGLIGLTAQSTLAGRQFEVVYLLLSIAYVAASIGLVKRTKWGKVLGSIICCLMLLSIPLGTIIGIAGLVAFFKAPELFGKERITHKELKHEFKYRKKNKLKD